MQFIDCKKFATTTLDLGKKAFIMHMPYLKAKISISQAEKGLIAVLLAKKITLLDEYLDFADVFSKKLTTKLPKHFIINKYAFYLKSSK